MNNRIIDDIAIKMVGIRRNYVNLHNKLYDEIMNVINGDMNKLSSKNRELINETLFIMQRATTCAISDLIEEFMYSAMCNSKSRRFPKSITDALEKYFEIDQYPSDGNKSMLAKELGLTLTQVKNWFTNKRNRVKYGMSCYYKKDASQ
ncbi:Homeobox protein HD-1 [Dictyocoela muelleri]|nr:Homeobox protein HD-1 [Dictyocoela muelleri]